MSSWTKGLNMEIGLPGEVEVVVALHGEGANSQLF
jgi:hypothetical protein